MGKVVPITMGVDKDVYWSPVCSVSKDSILVPLFWYQLQMAMTLSFFSTNPLARVKDKTTSVDMNGDHGRA